MSNPVTTLKYLKHTNNYIKGEINKDINVYIKMSSIDSCIFDGTSSSLKLFCSSFVYYFPNIDVTIASDIVVHSLRM
jgi:hypothetical protein